MFDVRNTDFLLEHYVMESLGYWHVRMKEGKSHEPYKNLLNYGFDRILEGIDNNSVEERIAKRRDILELKEAFNDTNWNNMQDMRFMYLMCIYFSGNKDKGLFK